MLNPRSLLTIVTASLSLAVMGSLGCTPDTPPAEETEHANLQVSSEQAQPSIQPSEAAPTEAAPQDAPTAEMPTDKGVPVVRNPSQRARDLRLNPAVRAARQGVRPHQDKAGAAAAADAAPADGAAPRIVAVEPTHDYGTVTQGEEVVHTFVVKNEGPGKLVLERADAG